MAIEYTAPDGTLRPALDDDRLTALDALYYGSGWCPLGTYTGAVYGEVHDPCIPICKATCEASDTCTMFCRWAGGHRPFPVAMWPILHPIYTGPAL